jgi:integrase
LYLVVDDTGASRWLLRIVVRGRRRDFGLGSTSLVSLSDAREQADQFRRVARSGGDPKESSALTERVFTTFDELAKQVHEIRIKEASRNGKHIDQWINTLNRYASPVIGKKPVDLVKRSDIMTILEPIWFSKKETARRVLQRLSVVFDYALSHDLRADGNPVAGVERGLGSQRKKVKHFEAADWIEAANIYYWLKLNKCIGSLALQFTILTAVRSGAVRQARWSEFDELRFVWEIPENHMKSGQRFEVPLSKQAREVLKAAEVYRSGSDGLVFPSPLNPEKMLSENTMRKLLQSDRPSLTVHGFRTSFRQFSEEHTCKRSLGLTFCSIV